MKIGLFIFLLTSLIFNVNVFSKKHIGIINQFNDEGEKSGFWTDSTIYGVSEAYYKDGVI